MGSPFERSVSFTLTYEPSDARLRHAFSSVHPAIRYTQESIEMRVTDRRVGRQAVMFGALKAACDRSLGFTHKLEWLGPLFVRVTLGLVFVASGWGKLHSLDDVTRYFGSLGIPAPHAQAVFVATVELVGGLFLLLGLGTRIVAVFLIGVMAIALWTAKLPEVHGVVELAGTIELAYLAAFVWLALAGAGTASLDHLLGDRRRQLHPVGNAA